MTQQQTACRSVRHDLPSRTIRLRLVEVADSNRRQRGDEDPYLNRVLMFSHALRKSSHVLGGGIPTFHRRVFHYRNQGLHLLVIVNCSGIYDFWNLHKLTKPPQRWVIAPPKPPHKNYAQQPSKRN